MWQSSFVSRLRGVLTERRAKGRLGILLNKESEHLTLGKFGVQY